MAREHFESVQIELLDHANRFVAGMGWFWVLGLRTSIALPLRPAIILVKGSLLYLNVYCLS